MGGHRSPPGRSWVALGVSLDASWWLLWLTLGSLEASWSALVRSEVAPGRSGAPLELLLRLLGLSWPSPGLCWGALEGLLGLPWDPLDRQLRSPGALLGALGRSWSTLRALLGDSWNALGALLGAFGMLSGCVWDALDSI